MVNGYTEGIRASMLAQLDELTELAFDANEFAPIELVNKLAYFTGKLNREISVYISRNASVLDVTIGDSSTVGLANLNLRRGNDRLCGIRCLHTHPNSSSTLSEIDLQSLQKLRLDAMAAIGVNQEGRATSLSAAFLQESLGEGKYSLALTKPFVPSRIPQGGLMAQILEADKRITKVAIDTKKSVEKALLVGLGQSENEPSLLELASLAKTAGAQVAGIVYQNRSKMESATYIGQGKAREVGLMVQSHEIDLVIFDDELSGAQVRNLEQIIGCRVIDRATLILDIFAMRAKSKEGKLQVELAQLKYQLPRLTGLGAVLSRLGGGIGTRGPGETKLEVDRRRIRRTIVDIEKQIKEVKRQRDIRRNLREKNQVPIVAIVGYTNAGKSTLLNLLSGANVLAEDKLFATLDPITRKITLPNGLDCLLVDTVGFISKLPHDLVDAFQSTLEEAVFADLLLIVSDVADPNFAAHAEVVSQVLSELGAGDKQTIYAYNKADLAPEVATIKEDVVLISAKEGKGIDELLNLVEQKLRHLHRVVSLEVPYARGDVMAFLHKYGDVKQLQYGENGTTVEVMLDNISLGRVENMLGQTIE